MLASFLLVGMVACDQGPGPGPGPDDDDDLPSPTAVYLTPPQHLTRASLAIRGVRPSVADLEAVDADPAALPAIVDRYLTSPEFAATIRELHNETLLMRLEQGTFTYPAMGPLATATARQINSMFEEPLRLIEEVVMTDKPYTTIVTADYTMANKAVAASYDTWQRRQYAPERRGSGVLGMDVFYNRNRSAGFNYHRGRANTVSRAFLCHDFLDSDILLDTTIDLADPDVVANAVIANKSCAGCHQTLDPLASYMFTWRNTLAPVAVGGYPVTYFTPATAERWRTATKRSPMFFGVQATGMKGLGEVIAEDPRFARCTAQRFASYLTEVPLKDLSAAWVAKLQKDLVESGWNAKALVKSIVLSDRFRISHDTDEAKADTLVAALKVRPEQLTRMIEDLTGFDWSVTSPRTLRGIPYGTANLLDSDFIGYRVLFGGIDSYFVTDPVHTMNATSSLVGKKLSALAAEFVVEHDRTAPLAQRTLFTEAAVTATDPSVIRAQVAHLHARIYGELVATDSPEVDETYALYEEAFAASNDRARAWEMTLIGMLSDFRSLFY